MIEINSNGSSSSVAHPVNPSSQPQPVTASTASEVNKAILQNIQKTSDASLNTNDSGIDGSSVYSDNTNMSNASKATTSSSGHGSSSQTQNRHHANCAPTTAAQQGKTQNGADNGAVGNHEVMSDEVGSSVILEEVESKDDNQSANANNE